MLDYVLVLYQLSFGAIYFQMAVHDNLQIQHCAEIEHVKRPGESHEGVGRKKKLSFSHKIMSYLLFHYFCFTTLVATRRRRCVPRSAWVRSYATGCALWSLGSWLEGSWVSALCFVASLTPQYGPFCSCFLVCFCFVFDGHTRRWHTRCHRAHNCQELVAVPLFPWLLFVSCFWWLLFCVVFRLLFWWDRLLDYVQVHYQLSFVAICFQTAGHDNLQIHRFAEIERVKRPGESHEGVGRKKKEKKLSAKSQRCLVRAWFAGRHWQSS